MKLGMLNEVRIFEIRLKYSDSNSFFAPLIFDSEICWWT